MPIGFRGIDIRKDGPLGWGCPTGAKYEQRATLLRQGYASNVPVIDTEGNAGSEKADSFYVQQYHEITGEPLRDWVEATVPSTDDPGTPDVDESTNPPKVVTFECQARSIITGGLNSQGTTERWTSKGEYENVDFVELTVPAHVSISRRDRVTNITNSSGQIVWREEEAGIFKPTVFDVLGVAPSLDMFGSLVEWFILARRSEEQRGVEGRGT